MMYYIKNVNFMVNLRPVRAPIEVGALGATERVGQRGADHLGLRGLEQQLELAEVLGHSQAQCVEDLVIRLAGFQRAQIGGCALWYGLSVYSASDRRGGMCAFEQHHFRAFEISCCAQAASLEYALSVARTFSVTPSSSMRTAEERRTHARPTGGWGTSSAELKRVATESMAFAI